MPRSLKRRNPKGERQNASRKMIPAPVCVDTYDGKVHIEWDSDAAVTPMGLLPFFIQFLKMGGRFDAWVNESPLAFQSNNAPQKVDVLGSLFLSILSFIINTTCVKIFPFTLFLKKLYLH